MCRNDWIKGEKNMMEKILLGSSYLAQAIVMATIAFAVISWAIAHRHPKDYGAKTAKIISAFMIVCFVGNLIQIISQDSIIPMLATSIVCAVISRKTIRY